MRTTLTLDDDVAVQLERMRVEKRITLKEAVNSVLRRGLATPEKPAKAKKRFKTKGFKGATAVLSNFDDIGEVMSMMDEGVFD